MTNKLDYNLLKRLYSIHSPSGKEDRLINFIVSYIKTLPGKIEIRKDKYGNIYAWKGEADSYPCIVAHLDQVQKTHSRDFKAIETRDIIFGYSPKNHQFEGLGADDKNGILIALESLKNYDCIKIALFREEEIGCRGSQNCEMTFFADCRFVIQCDRRGNSDLITSIGFTDLCSEEFIRAVNPEKWGYHEETGLMTDVETLVENGLGISAINMSCGYFNPHTDEEITVKRDFEKCWRLVQHIIEDCTATYPHTPSDYGYGRGYYDDWDMEDEVWQQLSLDPTLTASDFYEQYHEAYPYLTLYDYEQMIHGFQLMQEESNDQTNNPNGTKENNQEEIIF